MVRNKRQNKYSGRRQKTFPNVRLLYIACVAAIIIGAWKSCSSSGQSWTCDESMPQSHALTYVKTPAGLPQKMLTYPGFTISFNPQAHVPNWVAWQLTREMTEGQIPRADKFSPDDTVPGCPHLSDYRNSGFSRGHMAPSADMKWSKEAMSACFMLTNICPQHSRLNSGTWKSLEEKSRKWAQRDSAIIIICGPILTDKITRHIGKTEVVVPERFFKVILSPYTHPPRGIGFIMPNGTVQGGMQQAAVTIDEIEEITGFDFFSALPDDIETQVESQCNFPLWNRHN